MGAFGSKADQGVIWDRFAAGYSKQPIADVESYETKLKVTREYLRQTDKLLEFGCGTGGTAILHAPHVAHILATDISEQMIAIARAKAKDVPNVEFRQSSIENLNLQPSCMDVVLGLNILHLLPDKKGAIQNVHTWLKPGGYFVSSTACVGELSSLKKALLVPVFAAGRSIGLLPSLQIFGKDEFKALLTNGGFQIVHEWQKDSAIFIVAKKTE